MQAVFALLVGGHTAIFHAVTQFDGSGPGGRAGGRCVLAALQDLERAGRVGPRVAAPNGRSRGGRKFVVNRAWMLVFPGHDTVWEVSWKGGRAVAADASKMDPDFGVAIANPVQ
jgi:hypothetical protein